MSVARFVLIGMPFNLCRFLFFNVKYKVNLCCSRYMYFGCKSTLVYMFTAVPGNIVHIDHVSNNPNTFKGIISPSCCLKLFVFRLLILKYQEATALYSFPQSSILNKTGQLSVMIIMGAWEIHTSAWKPRTEHRCHKLREKSGSNQYQWRFYIVNFGRDTPPPPGVQILSISCNFWETLAKLYVGAPTPRVGAPTSRKSWIRHWIRLFILRAANNWNTPNPRIC